MEATPPESYDHGRDACYESKLFALSFELSPQRIAQAKFIEDAAVVAPPKSQLFFENCTIKEEAIVMLCSISLSAL